MEIKDIYNEQTAIMMISNNNKLSIVLKLLIVGSLPPPLGGTSVSLANLMEELRRRGDIEVKIVNTGQIRGGGLVAPFRIGCVLFQVIIISRWADVVSTHLCDGPPVFLGIFILWLCRLMRKPLVVRKFGGNWFEAGALVDRLAIYVAREADAFLLQTRILLERAKQAGISNVHWYPTSRQKPRAGLMSGRPRHICRRFVYLGHVRRVKGIREIIKAGETLPVDATIDIYGPFLSDLSEKDFEGQKRVLYRGIVPPDDAITVLSRYDALLLPTYHIGEGYAGVVIEAYFAGIPVICTRWQALPEIVDETCGILIPPYDPVALAEAMLSMMQDEEHYWNLCEGARAKQEQFSAEHWADEFVRISRSCLKTNEP